MEGGEERGRQGKNIKSKKKKKERNGERYCVHGLEDST